jgi:hypothetical protein
MKGLLLAMAKNEFVKNVYPADKTLARLRLEPTIA